MNFKEAALTLGIGVAAVGGFFLFMWAVTTIKLVTFILFGVGILAICFGVGSLIRTLIDILR